MTTTPKRRKGTKPHQRAELPPVVQPPASMAHLQGDALYEALTTENDWWDGWRLAAESGRGKSAVDKWLGNLRKAQRGERPFDDNTIIEPRYFGDTPVWHAGQVRAWLMRTSKMRRNGTFVPYKPGGRRAGVTETKKRAARPSLLDQVGPQLLAEYEQLIQGPDRVSSAEAYQALADRHGITARKAIRRVQHGRDMRRAATTTTS